MFHVMHLLLPLLLFVHAPVIHLLLLLLCLQLCWRRCWPWSSSWASPPTPRCAREGEAAATNA